MLNCTRRAERIIMFSLTSSVVWAVVACVYTPGEYGLLASSVACGAMAGYVYGWL